LAVQFDVGELSLGSYAEKPFQRSFFIGTKGALVGVSSSIWDHSQNGHDPNNGKDLVFLTQMLAIAILFLDQP